MKATTQQVQHDPAETIDGLLATRDIRRILNISDRCLRRWISRGLFPPGFKIATSLRWRRSVVEEWIRTQEKS